MGFSKYCISDEDIDFNQIICEVNGKDYYYTHQIINRIYESNVFLMTEDSDLSNIIKRSDSIKCKIKYLDMRRVMI